MEMDGRHAWRPPSVILRYPEGSGHHPSGPSCLARRPWQN